MFSFFINSYLYTVLVVSFGESAKSATRITSLYSFTAMLTGTIAGFVVRYVRRLKWCAVLGALLYTFGLGLMIKFRTSGDNGYAGVIGAQIGKDSIVFLFFQKKKNN